MAKPFTVLLHKFLTGNLDQDELQEFLKMLRSPENEQALRIALDEKLKSASGDPLPDTAATEELFYSIMRKSQSDQQAEEIFLRPRRYTGLVRAAAVILLLAGTAVYYFSVVPLRKQSVAVVQKPSGTLQDVQPGSNKAILTLSNGSTIVLGAGQKKTLAHETNADIVQLHDGQLAYQPSRSDASSLVYNTMTTPAGGQYEVILPDGSHVWLNASSSLTYPTAFKKGERVVQLKGEGYFEVVHNREAPFTVQVNDMKVNVLGTHFNINAYDDEKFRKTTLLEGSVQVTTMTGTATLRQGQQVRTSPDGQTVLVSNPDLEESIAWKNGLFSFDNADLASIMRQFARWYDLKVRYEGNVSERRFTGDVFRNLTLSEALKVLELNDVHFRIEGNNLTVIQ